MAVSRLLSFQNHNSESKALNHPIHGLPNELLILIFKLTIESESARLSYISPSSTSTPSQSKPLVLAFVCRRWRSIILAIPDLWSHITITSVHEPRRFQRPLSIHLERSRGASNGTQLTIRNDTVGSWNDTLAVLRLVALYSRELRSLKTRVLTSEMWDILQLSSPLDSLCFPIPRSTSQLNTLNDSFRRSPLALASLRELAFPAADDIMVRGTLNCDLVSRLSGLPWNQITSLEFATDRVDNFLTFLPALRHLGIELVPTRHVRSEALVPIEIELGISSLKMSLAWEWALSHTVVMDFFSNLSCPELHRLEIEHFGYQQKRVVHGIGLREKLETFVDGLEAFMARSKCSEALTHLVLTKVPLHDDGFVRVLRATCGVIYLSVQEPSDDYQWIALDGVWIARLCAPESVASVILPDIKEFLLPNLRDLRIGVADKWWSKGIIIPTFERIIRSRSHTRVLHSAIIDLPTTAFPQPFSKVTDSERFSLDRLKGLQRDERTAIKVVCGSRVLVGYENSKNNREYVESKEETRKGWVQRLSAFTSSFGK
ncbi:hypothetical protein AAF712_011422 [Marasmius tenuissimus]|uniref:F-box domain-containing protein n=1 Tax=Marasmius tenuissimus TaxID=585030 RepID=A0ABR2ZLE2_9AGAR